MVKFTYIYIYIVLPGSPGLRDCPNRAPTWPNKALPNRPRNPTDSPHTPLLHVSGLSPERGYMLNDTIIHFLHMEPSILRLITQQAFREFLVSLAHISNLNSHKSVELSHVKCKILTYFMMSFICSL